MDNWGNGYFVQDRGRECELLYLAGYIKDGDHTTENWRLIARTQGDDVVLKDDYTDEDAGMVEEFAEYFECTVAKSA